MNNKLLNKFKKSTWKPGTIEYPLPAVMVSTRRYGQLKHNNSCLDWSYMFRSGDGVYFCKAIKIFI